MIAQKKDVVHMKEMEIKLKNLVVNLLDIQNVKKFSIMNVMS